MDEMKIMRSAKNWNRKEKPKDNMLDKVRRVINIVKIDSSLNTLEEAFPSFSKIREERYETINMLGEIRYQSCSA